MHPRTRIHTLQTLLTVWACGSWTVLSGIASCSRLCWPNPTSRTRQWWSLWTCHSPGPSWSPWSVGLRLSGNTSRPYRYQTNSSKLCRRTVSVLYLEVYPQMQYNSLLCVALCIVYNVYVYICVYVAVWGDLVHNNIVCVAHSVHEWCIIQTQGQNWRPSLHMSLM